MSDREAFTSVAPVAEHGANRNATTFDIASFDEVNTRPRVPKVAGGSALAFALPLPNKNDLSAERCNHDGACGDKEGLPQ
jgi:hypothetical protein